MKIVAGEWNAGKYADYTLSGKDHIKITVSTLEPVVVTVKDINDRKIPVHVFKTGTHTETFQVEAYKTLELHSPKEFGFKVDRNPIVTGKRRVRELRP